MIRFIITFFMISLSVLPGQQGFADAFQSLGTSGRMAGLGQAVVADFGHDASYIINPAASGSLSGSRAYALYINQFGMAEYGAGGFSKTTPSAWRWGVHGIGLFIDNILERPDLRSITDLETRRDSIRVLVTQGFASFSDLELSLTFNLAREFKYNLDLGWQMEIIPLRIPVGMNINLIHKNLHEIQGSGIGVDVGTMLITDLKKIFFFQWLGEFAVGITGKHLNKQLDKKLKSILINLFPRNGQEVRTKVFHVSNILVVLWAFYVAYNGYVKRLTHLFQNFAGAYFTSRIHGV